MPAAYRIEDFIRACRKSEVEVSWQARNGGNDHFNLRDPLAIQKFIGNGGLEQLSLQNTKPLEKWPNDRAGRPMVDAYEFTSNKKKGYLAFYRNPADKWILKSFKPSIPKPAPGPLFFNNPFTNLDRWLTEAAEEKPLEESNE